MAFQNFRQLALAALVVVSSSLVASADVVFETIIAFETPAGTARPITGVAGASNGYGGGYGTQISGTALVPVDAYAGSYPAGFIAGYPTGSIYETIDLKSTDLAAVSGTSFDQHFRGTFTLSSGANGTGTVYVTGEILSEINARTTNTTFSLNTTTNPPGTGTSNPPGDVFTGGQLTGSLIRPYYTNAFGVDLNLRLIQGLSIATSGSNKTIQFTGAAFDAGSVSGYVPEPSTFSLLGLGAAGLAFGAYRRRNAAAAV